MSVVYLGLGANLENPVQQVSRALQTLRSSDVLEVEAVSSFYESQPWGGVKQPSFINAVVKVQTQLAPLALLDMLQYIEQQQKRQATVRWGPRTIDLDMLLFDSLDLALPRLRVPHPLMLQREFVIYPLHEIAPDLVMPSGEQIAAIKAQLPARGIKRCQIAEESA